MNRKATFVLAAIFAGLCLAYWGMLRTESSHQKAQDEAKRLFAMEPQDIASLEVQRVNEPVAEAKRDQGDHWAFVKPSPTIEANHVLWNRMATTFAGLMRERVINGGASKLAEYGLDEPVLTVVATKADGSKCRLEFGATDPTQTNRYAKGDDGNVILVNGKSVFELDRQLELLRNPYVLTIGKEGITRIEYARIWTGREPAATSDRQTPPKVGEESTMVAVEKTPEGRWNLVSPITAPANPELVEALVKEVQFATGHNFIDAPQSLADYGLDPAVARITVYSGVGSQPQTLLIGSLARQPAAKGEQKQQSGGLFAKQAARPAVFTMDANVLTLLPKSPEAFRENRLLTHNVADIRSIHYVTVDTDATLENNAEQGWRLAAPDTSSGDQLSIYNFVLFVKALEARGFPGDAKPEFGLDKPAIAITIQFKDDQPPATIKVGAKVPDVDEYYATQDNGCVVLLREYDVKGLTRTLFDFCSRTLLAFEKGTAARIAMQFDGANYVFEKPRGHWTVKEPAGKSVSSERDVEALADALSSVNAASVETESAPTNLEPFGLDKPVAAVSVSVGTDSEKAAGHIVGPLRIGAPVPGKSQYRYAMVANDTAIYQIRQSVVDDIRDALKGIQ